MHKLSEQINAFSPIKLSEIDSIKDSVKLMDRHDTKYVFSSDKTKSLLISLASIYRALEIDGQRVFEYENLYFDTDRDLFYTQHHNRKLNRYKLRYRKYVNSNTSYFEIKFKSNKKKTIKNRFKTTSINEDLPDKVKSKAHDILDNAPDFDLDEVIPKIYTSFSRLTLASPELGERITIDTSITYRTTDGQKEVLKDICVAEMKQAKLSFKSPFARAAKELRIYPSPFSKYCTGVSLLCKPRKINRFKKRLLNLKKLSQGELACLRT